MTLHQFRHDKNRAIALSGSGCGAFTRALFVLGVLFFSLLPANAVLTTLSYSPAPTDLRTLDHSMAYTWQIDNLPTENIQSATLTFTNIANWDNTANKLFVHLLDSAQSTGIGSFVDDPTHTMPQTDITDDFVSTRFHGDPKWLTAPGTLDTKLFGKSFGSTGSTYTYNFSATDLAALTSYINNSGNIAFGLDPDCHYSNDGISFGVTFNGATGAPQLALGPASPIPEGSALLPLAGILTLAVCVQSRQRRRS